MPVLTPERKAIRDSGLYQWQVCDFLKIGEATLCRWLRHPTAEQSQRIFDAVNTLKEGGAFR